MHNTIYMHIHEYKHANCYFLILIQMATNHTHYSDLVKSLSITIYPACTLFCDPLSPFPPTINTLLSVFSVHRLFFPLFNLFTFLTLSTLTAVSLFSGSTSLPPLCQFILVTRFRI